jgi:hypothetical protein
MRSLKDRIPESERALLWNTLRFNSPEWAEKEEKKKEIYSIFHEIFLRWYGEENYKTFLGARRIALTARNIGIYPGDFKGVGLNKADLEKLKIFDVTSNGSKPWEYPYPMFDEYQDDLCVDKITSAENFDQDLWRTLGQLIKEFSELTDKLNKYEEEDDWFDGWPGHYKLVPGKTYGILRSQKPEWFKVLCKACGITEADFSELRPNEDKTEKKDIRQEAIERVKSALIVE